MDLKVGGEEGGGEGRREGERGGGEGGWKGMKEDDACIDPKTSVLFLQHPEEH